MSDQRRRLLPYEYELIDALGISKEEYFNFLDVRQQYKDVKEGTVLDVRNWPAVAIVLIVLGTILQVVAALLPAEEQPQAQQGGEGGINQTRDDVFAPRTRFNSVQQVAEYGTPVNLVYANRSINPNGGARIATSLLWSALRSYGSSQFVQMLALISAGPIGEIDQKLTAFGQAPVRDLVAQNYWIYFNDYQTGKLANIDLLPDPYGLTKETDPTKAGGNSANPYRIPYGADNTERKDGFSQAFSLSSSQSFGFYSPIALNVNLYVRNNNGDRESASNKVTASLSSWSSRLNQISVGNKLTVSIAKVDTDKPNVAQKEANDYRRQVVNVFDNASIFKLGSALFSVVKIDRSDIEDANANVTLQCIEAGYSPTVQYNKTNFMDGGNDLDIIITGSASLLAEQAIVDKWQSLVTKFEKEDKTGDDIDKIYKKGKTQSVSTETRYRTEQRSGRLGSYTVQVPYTEEVYTDITILSTSDKGAIKQYIDAKNKIKNAGTGSKVSLIDVFGLKALVRIEKAKYETISPCNIVDIAIKSTVYRRISGRQEEYGQERRKGYPSSDNGIKSRTAIFLLKYKKASQDDYSYVPGFFVIRRAADQENFNYLRFNSGKTGEANATHWSFELEPVCDFSAELKKNTKIYGASGAVYYYIQNSGSPVNIDLPGTASIQIVGTKKTSKNGLPPVSDDLLDAREWDAFSLVADTQYSMSFDRGPEMQITAVTEQVVIDDIKTSLPNLYSDLSLVGFNLYSGKSVSDLRSLSMFVTKGRPARALRTKGTVNGVAWGKPGYEYLPPAGTIPTQEMVANTSYIITKVGNTNFQNYGLAKNVEAAVGVDFIATGPAPGTGQVKAQAYINTAPDIFLDTVLDQNDGIGKYASVSCVNLEQLAKSKKFCEKNKLFMDCVIADAQSWRSFWSQTAGFSLLELARIGGQDCLVPSVPYDSSTGEITQTIKVSALFNPGNIFEDSYKEEFIDYGVNTEDIIVTCIYRDLDKDGAFSRNRSVEVRRTYVDEDDEVKLNENDAIRQTVDMSAYVSSKEQAILVGKSLCQLRHYTRRAIEFKTFPTEAAISPGAYVYVELAQNEWQDIYTGTIRANSALDVPIGSKTSNGKIPNGTYNILIYDPNTGVSGTSTKSGIVIANGTVSGNALKAFNGKLFVLGKKINSKRVFRVTEVEMDEEGEVTIRGVEHPCDSNGKSLVSKGLTAKSTGVFTIDGKAS